MYDIAVIGGGVIGCSILNKLTRLGLHCVLLEKGSDVAVGTSKANSGIVHAGFDAKPNTLKAKLNVRGAKIMPNLCSQLNVPFINNGALVIGNDMSVVEELYDRGINNGVEGLEILGREELLQKLPSITDNITCGLYARTSGIVSPYKLTIALAEESVINGAKVIFNFDLKSCTSVENGYVLSDASTQIEAKKIILAVGGNHNNVAQILGSTTYPIEFRRGEYYLLDRNAMEIGGYTIFPLPSKASKGVLISNTVSGNIIVGPTSTPSENDLCTVTSSGLKEIAEKSSVMLNNVNLRKNIRVFSGVRTLVGDDFIIEKDPKNCDIINVTGICSPGLTACYAIAEMVAEILGLDITKEREIVRRKESPKINKLNSEELNNLIATEPRFGKIVCRCETISEMEIVNAIHSPLKPKTVDAIKRRTRAGMGRCQGGFCYLKVMEILAREYGITIDEIEKENNGSRIIVGDINS